MSDIDTAIDEVLKQFLVDLGEDGPINPLGEARYKLQAMITQAVVHELEQVAKRNGAEPLPSGLVGGYLGERIKQLKGDVV